MIILHIVSCGILAQTEAFVFSVEVISDLLKMTEKQPLKALNITNESQMRQHFTSMNINIGKRDTRPDMARVTNGNNIENQPPNQVEVVTKPISKSSQASFAGATDKQQIRNADSNDQDKPQYCVVYVQDIQSHYFFVEDKFLVASNYLEGRHFSSRHRGILIDRMISLHDRFQCAPEVLHLSINIIDRFLYQKPELRKTSLHLVGVTALLIASKMEEITSPVVEDLVEVTDNECSSNEILLMERTILIALDFRLLVPHALLFLRRFSKVGNVTPKVHMISKYAIELAHVEMAVVHIKPSKVAAAALFLAMKIVDRLSTWDCTMEHYARYRREDLSELAKTMYNLIRKAPASSLKATYSKYCNRRCSRIALLPELGTLRTEILEH